MTYEIAQRARRRTQRVVVTGVIAAVSLLAVLVFVVSGEGPEAPAAGAQAPAEGQPMVNGGAAAGSDLELRPGPIGELPFSRSAGPFVERDGLASGFAQTELGAVLAAVHLAHRASPEVGSNIFEPTLNSQVIPSVDAEALKQITQARAQELAALHPVPAGKPYLTSSSTHYVGYSVVQPFEPNGTNIVKLLLSNTPTPESGQYIGMGLRVQWIDGDWKLLAPPEGVWLSALVDVPLAQLDTSADGGFKPFPTKEA